MVETKTWNYRPQIEEKPSMDSGKEKDLAPLSLSINVEEEQSVSVFLSLHYIVTHDMHS